MPKLETVRAKLLDLLRPGWATRIDTTKLNLSSCSSCILGQEFGDYAVGAEKVFGMRRDFDHNVEAAATEAGFVLGDADVLDRGVEDCQGYYSNLTKAWKREIAKRVEG